MTVRYASDDVKRVETAGGPRRSQPHPGVVMSDWSRSGKRHAEGVGLRVGPCRRSWMRVGSARPRSLDGSPRRPGGCRCPRTLFQVRPHALRLIVVRARNPIRSWPGGSCACPRNSTSRSTGWAISLIISLAVHHGESAVDHDHVGPEGRYREVVDVEEVARAKMVVAPPGARADNPRPCRC